MSKPFSVQRIDHVVFRVRDLSRSVGFYRDVLGCDVVRAREHLGLVHLRAGASMIDLVSVGGKLGARGRAAPTSQAKNVDHVCLRVEPFDESELISHLKRHALSPLGGAEINFGAEGDGLSLRFADPDGNVIELKGPPTIHGDAGRRAAPKNPPDASLQAPLR
ncbi:MAG: VOC family protein [Pseudomonadota bacterium]|nr:VOC family protein [Pseudomonadota bacterium]